MKRNPTARGHVSPPMEPWDIDDDVDPRVFFSRNRHPRGPSHQAERLCATVFHVLSGVLAAEVSDRALQALELRAVEPAPDVSRLRVIVQLHEKVPVEVVEERLRAASGLMRLAVSQAVQRKRTPQLVFVVLPFAGEEP